MQGRKKHSLSPRWGTFLWLALAERFQLYCSLKRGAIYKAVLFHANSKFRIHTTKMEWRRITCCETALFLFEAGKFIEVLAPRPGWSILPNLSFMLTENSFVHFYYSGDFLKLHSTCSKAERRHSGHILEMRSITSHRKVMTDSSKIHPSESHSEPRYGQA